MLALRSILRTSGSQCQVAPGEPREYCWSLMSPTNPVSPLPRCAWAKRPLDIQYHDREWGVPQHDDRVLFEFLVLEGAQAGLSWSTILDKRHNYRNVFNNFDPRKVARYDARK